MSFTVFIYLLVRTREQKIFPATNANEATVDPKETF